MILWIVVSIAMVVCAVIVVVMMIASSNKAAKEQGPMPKRHGGFGQRVHGGKS